MSKQWYVIHTYSGHENKVKASLEERLHATGLHARVGQILVPTEDVVEIKGGKRKVSSRKFFPGYLLIEAEMDDDDW
jgi:transcriptional antiterminator NusG